MLFLDVDNLELDIMHALSTLVSKRNKNNCLRTTLRISESSCIICGVDLLNQHRLYFVLWKVCGRRDGILFSFFLSCDITNLIFWIFWKHENLFFIEPKYILICSTLILDGTYANTFLTKDCIVLPDPSREFIIFLSWFLLYNLSGVSRFFLLFTFLWSEIF